jgi:hypothetical protein
MKYDDASWHYGGDYPKGLPPENGATHIGMFLAWIIEHGLEGELQREEAAKELAAVRKRKMTGAQFLLAVCDEKLTDDDLSDEGNRFTAAYFAKKYIDDYSRVFGDEVESLYELADTWANYDRLRPLIDQRYEAFKKKPGKKTAAPKKAVTKKAVTKKKGTPKKAAAKKKPATKKKR